MAFVMVLLAMILAACAHLPMFGSADTCPGATTGNFYDFVDAHPREGYASVEEAVRAAPGVPIREGDVLRETDDGPLKEVLVQRGLRLVAKVTLDRAQDGGWRAIGSEFCGW